VLHAVVGTIAFQGLLNQPVNSGSDTKVQIKGDGELAKEVCLEWYAVQITKSFYIRMDRDMGAAVVSQSK
jgi:hypothetical protein